MKKRILTMALVAVMAITSVVPAMAAGSPVSTRGSIGYSGSGSSASGSGSSSAYSPLMNLTGPWSAAGWAETPGEWVGNTLVNNGYLFTNTWIVKNGVWYYMDATGNKVVGYNVVNGVGYNFDANGICQYN